jgi:nucleotide-binding universal stress UspA family protein
MSGIVVGVDGSEGAAHALRWAAREGRLHGQLVTAVLAWGHPDRHHVAASGFEASYTDADAQKALDEILERTLDADGALLVQRQTVCGSPAARLLEVAQHANLLVVGSRGLGGFRELLLGSVSQHCLHHAEVPVAIVHPARATPRATGERIVVGVDGSATAQHALAWALDEARLRHAAIDVVHAWNMPPVVSPYAPSGTGISVLDDTARLVLEDALELADLRGLPTPVARTVKCGSAAHSILEEAKDADLIVLGSRGRGGFTSVLLGSVTHQVTHHATCPVVVLPAVRG